jgi:hypothetical protein
MTPKDCANTGQLLNQFNAECLGDGELDAGTNILAAMALTVANLQRPDSVVLSPDGSRTSLGCRFVVSGAFSAGLVAGNVILPLQTRQGGLSANVRDWHEFEERERERIEKTGRVLDGCFLPLPSQGVSAANCSSPTPAARLARRCGHSQARVEPLRVVRKGVGLFGREGPGPR